MGHCENYENRMDARYEKGGGVAKNVMTTSKYVRVKEESHRYFKQYLRHIPKKPGHFREKLGDYPKKLRVFFQNYGLSSGRSRKYRKSSMPFAMKR